MASPAALARHMAARHKGGESSNAKEDHEQLKVFNA